MNFKVGGSQLVLSHWEALPEVTSRQACPNDDPRLRFVRCFNQFAHSSLWESAVKLRFLRCARNMAISG